MNEILQKVKEWFIGEPFDIKTQYRVKKAIRDLIYIKYPKIKKQAYVKGHEIHIAGWIVREDRDIIWYLPYILDIKENYFYDLYIGMSVNYQVAYEEMIDYSKFDFGYKTQIRKINSEMPEVKIIFREK